MNHNEVVRQKLAEQYLLDELQGETRDEFEEHFFECQECALDIRAGSEFVTHSRHVLSENRPQNQRNERADRNPFAGWFAWLRPAFAVPAFAVLLLLVGYQNLVTVPRLRGELGQPKVLPWAAVAVGTWGSSGPTIAVSAGKGFLLFVRIPPDGNYARYTADLYNSSGRLEYSLSIPATPGVDQWPVMVPEGNHEAGNYRILVRGVAPSGEVKDLGSAAFTLQVQK